MLRSRRSYLNSDGGLRLSSVDDERPMLESLLLSELQLKISHSECLYFPDMVIDKVSRDTLARLVLCWERIWTIVPEGMERPSGEVDKDLSAQGIVQSLPVAPYSTAVRLAGDAVDKACEEGGLETVLRSDRDGYTALYDQKMTDTIRASLHYGKLPSDFSGVTGARGDKYWAVSQKFAAAYMTVLAKYLADQMHLSLITDRQSEYDLSCIAALGRPAPPGDLSMNELLDDEGKVSYAECLLHQFIVRDLRIDPDVTITRLAKFRKTYPSEVSRYREALQSWASDETLQSALLQSDENRMRNWCKTNIEAPLNDLAAALQGAGISCTMEQAVKISAMTTPASGLAMTVGLPPTIALGAQAGISLAYSVVKFREDRKKTLDGKPYAYLYRLNRKFRN